MKHPMTAWNAEIRIWKETDDRIVPKISVQLCQKAADKTYNRFWWETDDRIKSAIKIILKNHNKKEKT